MNKRPNCQKILLIACSDLPIDPVNILGCSPEHVLTLQNLAGLIGPHDKAKPDLSVSSLLEYAVCEVGVTEIFITGHAPCQSLGVLLNNAAHTHAVKGSTFSEIGKNLNNDLQTFVSSHRIEESNYSKQALLFSLHNLQAYPQIKKKSEAGLLSLHAWHLNHDLQKVEQFDSQTKRFMDVADFQKPY